MEINIYQLSSTSVCWRLCICCCLAGNISSCFDSISYTCGCRQYVLIRYLL